jgi:pyrroloquinoline-quinone synthase
MPVTIIDCRSVLDHAATQRRLLDHPFYRAWQDGELTGNDLADYATQYRHVEQILPATLEATAAQLPVGHARRLVEGNLADELSRPRPHVELLDDFASAVGADTASPPSPATAQLIATYQNAVPAGPVATLAVVGAYEVQAAEVAATKAQSLRSHYRLDSTGTRFWDVHAQLEGSHANWTAEAIEELSPTLEDVSRFAAASATAWWAFLDEREASRRD